MIHLKDFLNTKDHTKAVQKALDAAKGEQLYIDPGTYTISEPLLVNSNTKVTGAGSTSILKFTWNDQNDGPEFHFGNKNRKNIDHGDSNIELSNFVIEGGSTGLPYGIDNHSVTHGLSFRKVHKVKVYGLEVRNTSGFGIVNTGIKYSKFENNKVHDVGRDGITSFALINENIPEFDNFQLTNLDIINNEIYNVGDDGIAVHAGTEFSHNKTFPPAYITISKNKIRGRLSQDKNAQGRGICLSGVYTATVCLNQIFDTVSTGILLQELKYLNCEDIEIFSNFIINAGKSEGLDRPKFGIQIKNSANIEVIDNALLHPYDRGIDIRSSEDIGVNRNLIYKSLGNFSILAADPASNVSIVNNVCYHKSPAIKLFKVKEGIEEDNIEIHD